MKDYTNDHLYFAYGSNLDPIQMESRCPNARPAWIARAGGWRFRIYERGYATITKSPGQEVWGGLWAVSDTNLRNLDRYEGVSSGLYRKSKISVVADGRSIDVFVYIANQIGRASCRERG